MSSKKINTRDRILSASWKLLEKNVGKGVPMSSIAKRAGVSRQALYLHFKTRADLLLATAKYIDEVSDVDAMLAKSREAKSGLERLDAFIDAWGNYIPTVYGAAKALMAAKDFDDASATAWNDRMMALKEGCEAAVLALHNDEALINGLNPQKATDILWTQLSVANWEMLVKECGWSQKDYITHVKSQALTTLTK